MSLLDLFRNKNERIESGAFFHKDEEGQWWFLGIYSNKFEDLDGEILAEESHLEYIEWLKETGFKPVVTAYHLPRAPREFWPVVFDKVESDVKTLQEIVDYFFEPFAFAKAERVFYLNGFVVVLAKVLAGREEVAEKLSEHNSLGMSHGFINKKSSANIFKQYRTFEMSVLRSVRAANMFTLSTLFQKGAVMTKEDSKEKGLTPEDRNLLVSVFGEELVDKFATHTEAVGKVLSRYLAFKGVEMGDTNKEVETPVEGVKEEEKQVEVTTEETPDTSENGEKQEVEGPTLKEVAEATAKTFGDLHQVVVEMQARLEKIEKENEILRADLAESKKQVEKVKEEVKKSEDELIASAWLPPFNWKGGYSASTEEETVINDENEKEAIITAPPKGEKSGVDMSNPLYLGFWNHLEAGQ